MNWRLRYVEKNGHVSPWAPCSGGFADTVTQVFGPEARRVRVDLIGGAHWEFRREGM